MREVLHVCDEGFSLADDFPDLIHQPFNLANEGKTLAPYVQTLVTESFTLVDEVPRLVGEGLTLVHEVQTLVHEVSNLAGGFFAPVARKEWQKFQAPRKICVRKTPAQTFS